MTLRNWRIGVAIALIGGLALNAQSRGRNRWAQYEGEMQDPVDDPPDANRRGEFALGRLRYHSPMDGGRFYSRWGIDVNKGDRLFLSHLIRLTRIDVESIENIVDISTDHIFETPWMFAGSVGDWRIAPTEAARMREYFQRGGFLMVDDFHNPREWATFMSGMQQMDPSMQAVELEDGDPMFQAVYNLDKRIRVPGANVVHGNQIERGGVEPHWRAIRDPKGRAIVAICFNMDVGDGWEFADVPDYPEKYASEGIRLGVNYVVYAMTH
jgi:hypothetical protein